MVKHALVPSRRNVLLVEDEALAARVLKQTLNRLGYAPCGVAASADEALARAADVAPDIALVDIRIHGQIDGIETAALLRSRFGIPVIYITAHADDATLARAARTRPYGYLVKPVKPDALKSAIEVALRRHAEEGGPETEGAAAPPKVVPLRPPSRGNGEPEAEAVRTELDRLLGSPDFDATRRSREFLRFVVEEKLAGRGEALTQAEIAVRVFGRKEDFDPLDDPIVRIQAGRLRRSLERYYLLSGRNDPLGIELPRGHYAPRFSQRPEAGPSPAPAARSASYRGDWPTIAVQRSEFAGDDPTLLAMASRFDEELAAELGRYRDVRVRPWEPAPGTPAGARFALSASVRAAGAGFRTAVRLLDGASGEQVWADAQWCTGEGRRKGSIEDVARVIAARTASEEGIVVQILATESRKQSFADTSFGAVLRSYDFYFVRDATRFEEALLALRRAVALDPECSPAWTRLARLSLANHAFGLGSSATTLDEAGTCAQNGVRLDPTSRRARCVLGSIMVVKGELDAARREAEQALRLVPDSLVYLEIIGWLLTQVGDWERGAALAQEAVERNPHHLPHAHVALWLASVQRGDHPAAYQAALEYRDTAFFWRPLMRASSLGLLGRPDDARHEVAELLRAKPNFAREGRVLIGHYVKFEDVLERIVEGLARVGLRLD